MLCLQLICVMFTINLYYGLILIHNGKFGQEHVNYQIFFFINSNVICYMNLSLVFSLFFFSLALFYIWSLFFLFLPFLLYESSPSSSYSVLVHLDNFWPYRTLLFLFFIMKRISISKVFLTISVPIWITFDLIGLFFCRFFIMNGNF